MRLVTWPISILNTPAAISAPRSSCTTTPLPPYPLLSYPCSLLLNGAAPLLQYCLPPQGDDDNETETPAWLNLDLTMEEYLDGSEVDCDLIFDGGKCVYGAITDNWPTLEPYFNETGSNCPSVLPRAVSAWVSAGHNLLWPALSPAGPSARHAARACLPLLCPLVTPIKAPSECVLGFCGGLTIIVANACLFRLLMGNACLLAWPAIVLCTAGPA